MNVNQRNVHSPATNNANNQADHSEGGRLSSAKNTPDARGRSTPPPMASGKNYALVHKGDVSSKASQSALGASSISDNIEVATDKFSIKNAPKISVGSKIKLGFMGKSREKSDQIAKKYNSFIEKKAAEKNAGIQRRGAENRGQMTVMTSRVVTSNPNITPEQEEAWADSISGANWEKKLAEVKDLDGAKGKDKVKGKKDNKKEKMPTSRMVPENKKLTASQKNAWESAVSGEEWEKTFSMVGKSTGAKGRDTN